jgi:heavy metal translocating P-type ATPase
MIHLGGILLVGAGLAAAPYVKKVFRSKGTALALTDDGLSESSTTDNVPKTLDSEGSTELAKPVETEVGRNKYRFALTTGTVGLAVVAQFGMPILIPITLVLIGYFSADIFKEAIMALKEKKIKVDILDTVVISLCLLFGQIGAAAFMVWILDLADLLLEKTRRKSRQYLSEIFGEQARFAWLLLDGQEIRVAVKDLQKDDIIIVNTGEQVPIDGLVLEGEAMIDQQSLTGEAAPVEKHEGDKVFAMTVLVAGKVQVQVQQTGENTLASKIIKIINDASMYHVKLQSVGEKIADDMVVPTLGLGALGLAVTGPNALLAIVNADFGTGIRVAAPIALLASLGVAAKNGLLIKDSKVLELLKDIDVILFDKTGTLTHEVPVVSAIIPADDSFEEDKILLYAATAEQKFSHPIAAAILKKAKEKNMVLPPHDESQYFVGLGIEVVVHGDDVKVGSSRYIERENIPIPFRIQEALDNARSRGQTAILTVINNQVAGMIELKSSVREEVPEIINYLKEKGIKEIALISGDHEAPTKELSRKLGVDRYFAGVLPHEKANYVKLLQSEGKKVMMVGDGINDSAALSYADIGVSLKGASTIAVDVADVIFMDGTLKKFNYLFEVSDLLHNNVQRSFYMIAIPNTLCIVGALMGFFGLASSLVLNNGFNLIAAINGTLPYAEAEKNKQKTMLTKPKANS